MLTWSARLQQEQQSQHQQQQRQQQQKQQIYRMKGTLAVVGAEVLHILQAVHETFEVEPSQSLVSEGGGDGGSEGGRKECRLVVIGKGLDEARLREGFLATAVNSTK